MSYYGDSEPLVVPPSGGMSYPVITQPTQPLGAKAGAAWLNTTTNVLSIYDGTKWIASTSPSALPNATKGDELLISTGPGQTWTPNDTIFLGNF